VPIIAVPVVIAGVVAFFLWRPMHRPPLVQQPVVPESSAPAATRAASSKPSFDCALASTWAEQQVCASDALAASDQTVVRLYRHRIAVASAGERERLRQEQRDWITQRNACSAASGISCVTQSYDDRIAELRAPSAAAAPAPGVPPQAATDAGPRPALAVVWDHGPSSAELAPYFPVAAREAGVVDGRAIVRCVLNTDGLLSDCNVLSETPRDLGFGGSALRAASLYKARTVGSDGQSEVGETVTFAIILRDAVPRRPPTQDQPRFGFR
jgi:uncharacterized protein